MENLSNNKSNEPDNSLIVNELLDKVLEFEKQYPDYYLDVIRNYIIEQKDYDESRDTTSIIRRCRATALIISQLTIHVYPEEIVSFIKEIDIKLGHHSDRLSIRDEFMYKGSEITGDKKRSIEFKPMKEGV